MRRRWLTATSSPAAIREDAKPFTNALIDLVEARPEVETILHPSELPA